MSSTFVREIVRLREVRLQRMRDIAKREDGRQARLCRPPLRP